MTATSNNEHVSSFSLIRLKKYVSKQKGTISRHGDTYILFKKLTTSLYKISTTRKLIILTMSS